jgi:hypothetical protein
MIAEDSILRVHSAKESQMVSKENKRNYADEEEEVSTAML